MEKVHDGMDLEMQRQSSPIAVNHGGGLGATQIMQRAILSIHSVHMFLAGNSSGSPLFPMVSSSKSIDSSPKQDENVYIITPTSHDGYEHTVEVAVECINSDQTTPLLQMADNTLHTKKPIRRLMHVLYSILVFKAHEASVAGAYGHCDATEQKAEVDEASDSLATSSGHQIPANQLQSSQSETIKNISSIVREKNLLALQEFGRLHGVKTALLTDFENGISENEAINRRRQHEFSSSLTLTNTFFHFLWEEVKKKTILLLLVGVVISTALEIIQEGVKYGCYDGVVMLIAVILLVFLSSIRKYWQEQRAQKKLQNHRSVEREEGKVRVIRGGEIIVICESELVWGDILYLKKGDEVPCDGLFVGGEQLELDYGSESCIINQQNPFLSYGERVIKGDARMVVTSTNMETEWSEMTSKGSDDLNTRFKLEIQLDKLNTRMHIMQIVISILIVIVLSFRYMAGKIDDKNAYRPESMAEPTAIRSFSDTFRKIIRESTYTTKVLTKLLCVSLVGLTEGVPFVVSLAIVYWNDKTLCSKAIEQDPHGVAKMAHVTRICTDTFITEDRVEVEKIIIGGELISGLTTPSPIVIKELCDGIDTLKHQPFRRVKDKFGFNSEKRWKLIEEKGGKLFEEPCGVLMKELEESEEMVWHFNGPVNDILNMCKHYYDIEGHKAPLHDEMKQKFVQTYQGIEHKHEPTTLAFACKPTCVRTQDVDDLILIALIGVTIKNKEYINAQFMALRNHGIETVIVSSKKISVLEDIAHICGVVNNGGSEPSVIKGEVFRNYTDKERLEKVDNIRVLAEALPSDKLLLVETMKKAGKVVVFLGQRTDEAPALKRANIGITMGTWSSKKAIENCDIMITSDDSFADLIISMHDSGRCIHHNIQSFLQLVLSATISSTLISIIETAAFGDASLTIYQLALVNFAVAFLGGSALLTKVSMDKPAHSIPIRCEQSIITAEMIRNILLQVSYQAICSVIIQLKGSALLDPCQDIKTMVSNIFIFCQFFNLFIARELQKKNFFRGIHRHKEFLVAAAMFLVLHASFLMVEDILGDGTGLKWKVWAACVLLGAVSWPVDWLGKCISLKRCNS